jgi:glucose/mannose-6-phosphate isomerase
VKRDCWIDASVTPAKAGVQRLIEFDEPFLFDNFAIGNRIEYIIAMKSPMFDYIFGFAEQLKTGHKIGSDTELPLRKFEHIILCGMGGSAIGGDLLVGYLKPTLTLPFLINRGYQLPGWVNDKSLVILSSYSGNTDETLSCFEAACRISAVCLAISSGGKLVELGQRKNIPCAIIPGGLPPRSALGYSFSVLYALFEKMGLTPECDFLRVISHLMKLREHYSITAGQPCQLAESLKGRVPVFYADGFRLEAVVSRFRCQLAENAKNLAFGNVFPEVNHNEIVGWGMPRTTIEDMTAVFIWDKDSVSHTLGQMRATKELLKKEGIKIFDIEGEGGNFLTRMLSLVHFADWLSYHLAVLNKVDPVPIIRIDKLKLEIQNPKSET